MLKIFVFWSNNGYFGVFQIFGLFWSFRKTILVFWTLKNLATLVFRPVRVVNSPDTGYVSCNLIETSISHCPKSSTHSGWSHARARPALSAAKQKT